jgi:XTP/dITP diphosphohydrolase
MDIKMKLIIASNNAHKVREIKKILSGKFDEILSLREANVFHETVEDGHTFMENALKKAREIVQITGCAALADDSGICVDALDGAPGIYSARYASSVCCNASDEANNALLLANLRDKEDWSAHYTSAVALVYPDGREVCAEGYMYGKIIDTPRGERGFGYDPIFIMDGESRTVAQMSDEEKNAVSHRAQALEILLAKI